MNVNLRLSDEQRIIFRLAWPAILEMALYMLVWIVDTAMVGHLGAEALSAVGLGGQFFWTVTWVFGSIGIGATIMVSRYVGAGNFERARRAGEQGLGVALVLGLLVWIGMRYITPWFFRLSHTEPVVSQMGMTYVNIVSLSSAPWIAGYAASSVLRGWGDTRTPLYIAATGNALNIIGDYALIYGRFGFPAMGVSGAAYATVASIIVRFLLSLIAVCRKGDYFEDNGEGTNGPGIQGTQTTPLLGTIARPGLNFRRVLTPDFKLIRTITRLSIPSGMEAFLAEGARTVNTVLLTVLGTVPFAAFQIVVAAESLSYMPGYGFAVASTVLMGQRLGKGDVEHAERGVGEAMRLALVLMSSVGAILALMPGAILSLFTGDREVILAGIPCLMLAALEQPLIAVADTLSAALKGAGDTKGPFYISAVTSWGFRFPLMFLAIRVLGYPLPVAWVIIVAGVALQAYLIRRRYKRGAWRHSDLLNAPGASSPSQD